ncbi:AraC family transcriptional regulator [Pedobacter sp. KBW06]|uniref:helix-turn-helix domain-containing protein n=1 Tax=Pedobacter sp. KBW06 TaxID=2153359 RepID=UPI000F59A52D|nr:AraC family transcriptional regulator [Pedobacter sp. KBW06]RQO70187.1 AraC family transcriptional regulator [Pedobacter sp. KBW06]
MVEQNLISIISIVAVFVSLLLSFFLLTVSTNNKLGNVLLAGFIILNAVDLSGWFIYPLTQHYPDLEVFRRTTSALINPLFFLYALAVCYSDFKLKPRHLLHAIPFVIENLYLTSVFYLVSAEDKTSFLNNQGGFTAGIVHLVVGHLQFAFYIIAIFLVLRKYKKVYLENYTNSATITYKWLFQLTVVITIVHTIVMFKDLLLFSGSSDIFNGAQIFVGVNAVFILCWFVMKALYYPDLFRGVDSRLQPIENMIALPEEESGLQKQELSVENQEKIGRLKAYMSRMEPYLEPSLTVQDLALQMEMPVRDLSILINHHLDQHFFDFVNEYRIQKAMAILKDPSKTELNIQEVLYQVGFNSKSSFNTAFKKYTNLTPTQFRNSLV